MLKLRAHAHNPDKFYYIREEHQHDRHPDISLRAELVHIIVGENDGKSCTFHLRRHSL